MTTNKTELLEITVTDFFSLHSISACVSSDFTVLYKS